MQFLDPLHPEGDAFAELRALVASPERIASASGRMLLELVEYLQSRGPTPKAGMTFFNNELWISLRHPARGVTVWVDWQDYGETRDGLPVMHFRIQISNPDSKLSDNHRATTIVEAACLILTV
jgi:hypothetical protein